MYNYLLQLDTLDIHINKVETWFLGLFLALVMYGISLSMRQCFFRGVFHRPKALFCGVIVQLAVLPMVTFLLLMCTRSLISPMVAMGMILVACCPGGAVSNFMTYHAKGNTELSVMMSSVTTLAAPVFMPLNFAIWGGLYSKYLDESARTVLMTLEVPLSHVFLTIVFIIGVPVLLGQLTVRYAPRVAERMSRMNRYFTITTFLVIVFFMVFRNVSMFTKYIGAIFAVVFIHNALALLVGFVSGKMARLPQRDLKAVTLEVGVQNSGLALLLLLNPLLFPPHLSNGGMVFVTAWWGVWHIVSGLITATIFRYLPERRRAC